MPEDGASEAPAPAPEAATLEEPAAEAPAAAKEAALPAQPAVVPQWGRAGELFTADGPLTDWSQAGYSGACSFRGGAAWQMMCMVGCGGFQGCCAQPVCLRSSPRSVPRMTHPVAPLDMHFMLQGMRTPFPTTRLTWM